MYKLNFKILFLCVQKEFIIVTECNIGFLLIWSHILLQSGLDSSQDDISHLYLLKI